jgi:hypothetical protein
MNDDSTKRIMAVIREELARAKPPSKEPSGLPDQPGNADYTDAGDPHAGCVPADPGYTGPEIVSGRGPGQSLH